MNKKNILKELIIIFWIFFIGSIFGFVCETIFATIKQGFFETRQGLVYGPFVPVYGIGAVIYYLLLSKINTDNKIKVFFITAILGGIVEYICSYVQEKVFGTISWDYSHLMFNINGRTSLLHCTYWGIAGIIYVLFVAPLVNSLREKLNDKTLRIITLVLIILILSDIGISLLAAERQTERRENVEAGGKIDELLDKYYPDEFMDKVYNNKKEV